MSRNGSGHWRLHPRSHPTKDGARRITIDARSDVHAVTLHLTTGEAAELMFELGAALEQAARDDKRATHDLVLLETVQGGRA